MVLLKRRNIFELCAMKQWKRWLATVRGAKRMRAGGSPLPMAGRLTQLAKIIFRDLYNRSSAVDSSSAP